ncbi:hypothetical protein FHS01_000063 [Longimicrobium terrae]|uniref:Uncharacterized protein n=1 Tax=Longimicrobium terrae TaxID=1639882 RepID=A0A841GV28_9BACT|nr:hypothetical protein [Longimicrobium terrae]MBB6069053.1 hypothetical protein [Longimicrobium terrae]
MNPPLEQREPPTHGRCRVHDRGFNCFTRPTRKWRPQSAEADFVFLEARFQPPGGIPPSRDRFRRFDACRRETLVACGHMM